ncbi:MAG: hypothetical protein ACE37I_19775 [Rubinisphaera brasiliensis]|uniref:hypothetical protein n=1 Tax=Rubinisphaera brasiliensis TaxID=119 RepID=UPI00391A2647
MAYQRLILHYGTDPDDFQGLINDEAVAGCWFDLHRLGGCGAGELRLKRDFVDRANLQPGEWIAFEYSLGERWYFGRVEQIDTVSPVGMRIQLQGAGVQLNEVFPGALQSNGAGQKPHLYVREDRFSADPDRPWESADSVVNSRELVDQLLQQYVVPGTHILREPTLLETGPLADDVTSAKFRGEESVRAIVKDLAMRARNASWGVDAERRFYFLQQKTDEQLELREEIDLTKLSETRSRDLLFNRLVLTGDYIYDRAEQSDQIARRSYRWRGSYRHVSSVEDHGERRIRLWVPWIRTAEDSRAFASEFLRTYSRPTSRYLLETTARSSLPIPWQGRVCLRDRQGTVLTEMQPETIRVLFDHAPRFRMELGPLDPHELWPEPPHDERWELPEAMSSGFGGSDYPTLTQNPPPPGLSSGPAGSSGTSAGNTEIGSSDSSAMSDESLNSEESLESSVSSGYGSSGYASSEADDSSSETEDSSSFPTESSSAVESSSETESSARERSSTGSDWDSSNDIFSSNTPDSESNLASSQWASSQRESFESQPESQPESLESTPESEDPGGPSNWTLYPY